MEWAHGAIRNKYKSYMHPMQKEMPISLQGKTNCSLNGMLCYVCYEGEAQNPNVWSEFGLERGWAW